jgi:PAS domain S-box-containing protein
MLDESRPETGLQTEVGDLRAQLAEARETLRAIRAGEIDAVVAETASGDRVFTLKSADHPYRIFIEQMTQGAATLSEDGVILYGNQALSDLLGESLNRLVGADLLRFVAEGDQAEFLQTVARVVGTPRPRGVDRARPRRNGIRGEFEFVSTRGERIPVDISVFSFPEEPAPMVCILATDLRDSRIHEALRSSEERFRAVAETVPDILYTASPDGTAEYLSGRFYEITGTALGTPPVEAWPLVLHAQDAAQTRAEWRIALAEGRSFEGKCRMRAADGSYRWFLFRNRPIRDEEGRVTRWLGCGTDVHNLVMAEESILRQTSKLNVQANELARSNRDLEDFAHIVAHDLKEPLRGIRNVSGFLVEDYGAQIGAAGLDKLNTLDRLAKRMHDLLDALLSYAMAGRSDLNAAPTDLNQVVAETVATLRTTLQREHGTVEISRRLPTVVCDRLLMGQVFANLITNGVKYNHAAEKRIEIGVREDGDDPVMYVKDNGIGVAPEHHELIFGIFKRLHTRDVYGGGAGAGLAIVKKIVERHGGRVWVESHADAGSTFCFTLPACPPQGN